MAKQQNKRKDSVSLQKVRKKKMQRSVPCARVCINAGMNNTIVTITDNRGAPLNTSSGGSCGFKNSKKATSTAAQDAASSALKTAVLNHGISEIDIITKGIGPNREVAVLALNKVIDEHRLIVRSMDDKTGVPHNGCRAKKPRRV